MTKNEVIKGSVKLTLDMFKCLQGKLDSLSITQESTTMFELQQPFPD